MGRDVKRSAQTVLALSSTALAGCAFVPQRGGLVCELQPLSVTTPARASQIPANVGSVPPSRADGAVLVYLDVWGQVVAIADDQGLRQPALGDPDTSVRISPIARCAVLPASAYRCPWCL